MPKLFYAGSLTGLLVRIKRAMRLAKKTANSAPQISASKSSRSAWRPGISIWNASSIMPNKVTISRGMESNGIAGVGLSLKASAQASRPKPLKAKKWATLSKPCTSPNRGNGGPDDSINVATIQPMISRQRKKMGLRLFD